MSNSEWHRDQNAGHTAEQKREPETPTAAICLRRISDTEIRYGLNDGSWVTLRSNTPISATRENTERACSSCRGTGWTGGHDSPLEACFMCNSPSYRKPWPR